MASTTAFLALRSNNSMCQNILEKNGTKSTYMITKEVANMKLNPKVSGKENIVAGMVENKKLLERKARTTRRVTRKISEPILMEVEETQAVDRPPARFVA